ncbi:MAG: hypothetical protein JSS27_07210 [Planctomycetes bacterium]|nr:hypothetical protein [Planctomycetota bacterium]
MSKTCDLIEVEVLQPLHFQPLGRKVRGHFDIREVARHDKDAAELFNKWPEPIPGQVLGIDLAKGEAYLAEPLRQPQHAPLRERLERLGKIGPERQTFAGASAATWLFWLRRIVESGAAKLTRGTFPQSLPGTPQTDFLTIKQPDPIDRLAAALERQNELMQKLLEHR